ncbi:hypothetical protein niasHS_011944 [Heterodera schachtii]|uniref:Uncharacterized protein n=1 Tax=Heterodera schachtii TaxID=97005 RepID=A0ABD2IM16_HETSC
MRRNGQRLAASGPNEQNSEQQRRLKKENAELMEQYIEQYEQKLKCEKQQAKTLEEIKGLESELAFKELVTDVLTKQLDEARKETDEERKAKEEERKAKEEERKEKEKQKEGTPQRLRGTPHSAHLKDQPKKMEEEQLENVDEEGGEDNIHKKGDIIIVGRPSLEEELKLLEKSADIEDTTSGSNATTPADHLPDQQVVLQCRDQKMDNSLGQTNETKTGGDESNFIVGPSLEQELKLLEKSPAKEDTKRGSSTATKAECLPHQQVVNPCQDQMIAIPFGSTEESDNKKGQICIRSAEKSAPSLTPCALGKPNIGQMVDIPLGQLEEEDGSHKEKICISSRMPNVDAVFAIGDDCESNEHTSSTNLPPVAAAKVGVVQHEPLDSSVNYCVRSGNISVFPTRAVAIRHFPSATTFRWVGLGLILGLIVFMVIVFFFVFGTPF